MARKTALTVDALERRSLLSGITYSLATDQQVYSVGQPINFTLVETNTGDQPALVAVFPTDFSIAQGGYVIWQSNQSVAGGPAEPELLEPGQSIIQTATWNGTTPYTLGTSTYALNHSGLFVVTNPNAPTSLRHFRLPIRWRPRSRPISRSTRWASRSR